MLDGTRFVVTTISSFSQDSDVPRTAQNDEVSNFELI